MPKFNLKYDYAGKYFVKVIFKGGYTIDWEMDFVPIVDKFPRQDQLTVESVVRQKAIRLKHPLEIEKVITIPKEIDRRKKPIGI